MLGDGVGTQLEELWDSASHVVGRASLEGDSSTEAVAREIYEAAKRCDEMVVALFQESEG